MTSNATSLVLLAVYLEVENKLLEAWSETDLATEVDREDKKVLEWRTRACIVVFDSDNRRNYIAADDEK